MQDLSRRELMLSSMLLAATFTPVGRLLAGQPQAKQIDAGALTQYANDGIYPDFSHEGFFIVRQNNRIVAQSSACAHKGYTITAVPNGFKCKKHGSEFSVDGKVTKGPAQHTLPRYGISLNDQKHLVVDLTKSFNEAQFNEAGAFLPAS